MVAVPGCGFFPSTSGPFEEPQRIEENDCSYHKRYIRFAFCKSDSTLASAAHKLREFARAKGSLG